MDCSNVDGEQPTNVEYVSCVQVYSYYSIMCVHTVQIIFTVLTGQSVPVITFCIASTSLT